MHVTYPGIEPKSRFKYYVCNNRYNHHSCDQEYIRAEILEASSEEAYAYRIFRFKQLGVRMDFGICYLVRVLLCVAPALDVLNGEPSKA
jgi:hypothetical protein